MPRKKGGRGGFTKSSPEEPLPRPRNNGQNYCVVLFLYQRTLVTSRRSNVVADVDDDAAWLIAMAGEGKGGKEEHFLLSLCLPLSLSFALASRNREAS